MQQKVFTGLVLVLIAASPSALSQPTTRPGPHHPKSQSSSHPKSQSSSNPKSQSPSQPPLKYPAQNRDELQKEREAIQQEMEQVKRSLAENHRNKKETLGQLGLLQRRLDLREAAIRNTNSRINVIQRDMEESSRRIAELRTVLDTLRAQYAESIVFAYKNRGSYDFLSFIFSVTSFNEAMERIKYIRSYRAYREEQAVNILRTQGLLQNKIDGLRTVREEKDETLEKQNQERQLLETEKKEKNVLITQIYSQEKELKMEMAAKQRQDRILSSAMEAAIRKARPAPLTSPTPAPLTSPKPAPAPSPSNKTDLSISGNIEKFIGRLPWPVQGTISMSFGLHEFIKHIHYYSQSITIDGAPGAAIKSVFEGEVQSVFMVGDVHAVMIRHGKYFTTYSNLATVSVAKGDQVNTGQIIGRVDGSGQLEFILSDEKSKNYDPEKWLKRY